MGLGFFRIEKFLRIRSELYGLVLKQIPEWFGKFRIDSKWISIRNFRQGCLIYFRFFLSLSLSLSVMYFPYRLKLMYTSILEIYFHALICVIESTSFDDKLELIAIPATAWSSSVGNFNYHTKKALNISSVTWPNINTLDGTRNA